MSKKWSQDLKYKNNVSKKKEKKIYIKSSLHPSYQHSPNKMSYINSPPKYDYSHIPKLLLLFVTSDKG